jgi:membrane fusion protein (multidrug efflux system)
MENTKIRRLLSSFGLYLIGLGVIIAAVFWVAWSRSVRDVSLKSEAEARAIEIQKGPPVTYVQVSQSPGSRTITFLGEARPFQEVTLYAKISGYVQKINVDKGDKAAADQVLAFIDSPETVQQYRAAQATLANKRAALRRAEELARVHFFSPQAVEDAKMAAQVAEANMAELGHLKNYQILKAPFAGTVTARFVDTGALVQNATNAQTSATPVVTVSETGRLRVYIYVDQNSAPLVHVGDEAEIVNPARPEKKLIAKVARMTGELDPRTRTLLTEIDVDNGDGYVLPGSFVQVALKAKTESFLEVPAAALILRGTKPFVGVIAPDDTLHFRPVTVAQHDGTTVRIRAGVNKGDRVALNVSDTVADGGKVQPVNASASK